MTPEQMRREEMEILYLKDRLQELAARMQGFVGTAAMIVDQAAAHLAKLTEEHLDERSRGHGVRRECAASPDADE